MIAILACLVLGAVGQFPQESENASLPLLTSAVESNADTASYEEVFDQLMDMAPLPTRVAAVSNLTIVRDVATIQMNSGIMYLLSPVGSRTVAAVFLGEGTFSFTPPNDVEREQLFRFYETESLEEPFQRLFLIFADSTLDELERSLTFGDGDVDGDVEKHIEYSLKYLSHKDSKYFDTSIMLTLLNGESNGLFYAHLSEKKNEPLIFQVNPFDDEPIQLMHRDKEARNDETPEVVNQFYAQGGLPSYSERKERRDVLRIGKYTVESFIENDLDFSARAKLDITWLHPGAEWIPLGLYYRLEVDSAVWGNGEPATYFRGEEGSYVWVRMDQLFADGDSLTLELHYHGDLIQTLQNGDWHVLRSAMFWYPWDVDGTVSEFAFDVTFHTPKRLTAVAVGDRVESTQDDDGNTTRWVMQRQIDHTSFSLGDFNSYELQPPGIPPLTVLLVDVSYRPLPPSGLNFEAQVGAAVANSLRFYQDVFGLPMEQHTYAVEIVSGHGQAFPGMIHLSFFTFFEEDDDGEHELFRAHEIAHQWWGVAVDGQTYRDKWLTEGMSQFAALWYLDVMLNRRKHSVDMLKEWREEIFDRGEEAGPLWLGTRVASSKHPEDYQLIIYNKGAWVLHMLRGLMQDEGPRSDATFTNMMREFYNTYRGGEVITEDFQEVVENHIGVEMDWFFDQWVYGNDLPTYEFSHQVEQTADGKYVVRVRVAQQYVPDDFRMTVPVRVEFDDDHFIDFPVLVTGPVTVAELPAVGTEPKKVMLNPDEAILAEVKNESWPGE